MCAAVISCQLLRQCSTVLLLQAEIQWGVARKEVQSSRKLQEMDWPSAVEACFVHHLLGLSLLNYSSPRRVQGYKSNTMFTLGRNRFHTCVKTVREGVALASRV